MHTFDLKCFCISAEELNITRAAERLHLSQQALSSKIVRLERSYGARFFKRAPKLHLTRSGELFLAYARDAIAREEHITSILAAESGKQSGFLTFGITQSRSQTILPRLLPKFQKENANVRISLEIRPVPQLARKLLDGDLELIICPSQSDFGDEIDQTVVMTDELCLAIPLEQFEKQGLSSLPREFQDPITLRERAASSGLFARLPYVLSGPQSRRIAMKFLRQFTEEPNIAIELYNTETIFTLPLLSAGAVFVFRSMEPLFSWLNCCSAVPQAILVPLGIPEALCDICVCTCKKHPVTLPMRAFISLAARELGNA